MSVLRLILSRTSSTVPGLRGTFPRRPVRLLEERPVPLLPPSLGLTVGGPEVGVDLWHVVVPRPQVEDVPDTRALGHPRPDDRHDAVVVVVGVHDA